MSAAARSGLAVLFSGGFNEKEALGSLTRAGISGFIKKPYRPWDLVAKLRQLVAPLEC